MQQENEQGNSTRALQKTLRASKMNDTYAVWKQIPRKKVINQKQSEQQVPRFTSLNDIPPSNKKQKKRQKNDVKGMTLNQYFKVRSQLDLQREIIQINQQDQEQINKYCNQQFQTQIKQENDISHKDVHTPNFSQFPEMKQKSVRKKSNNKQTLKTTKLKTQTSQHQPNNKYKSKSKNLKQHLQTIGDGQQQIIPMLDTFYKASKKKDITEYEIKNYKRNKMLGKVQHEKQRLMDIQASDMSFVTKHATKFNINKNICRQLIMDELRS